MSLLQFAGQLFLIICQMNEQTNIRLEELLSQFEEKRASMNWETSCEGGAYRCCYILKWQPTWAMKSHVNLRHPTSRKATRPRRSKLPTVPKGLMFPEILKVVFTYCSLVQECLSGARTAHVALTCEGNEPCCNSHHITESAYLYYHFYPKVFGVSPSISR